MAKIGTAHIEIKPVLDEAALEAITERIAEAVTEGVRRATHPRYVVAEATHEPECNDQCDLASGTHYLSAD